MTERAALRWGWVLAALWAATALAVVHPAVAGLYHDDGIYVATARSLAEDTGYRLIDLPGAPAQTKYPPLFPLVLSLVWRLAPAFPANVFWLKALGILASAAALPLLQRVALRAAGLAPAASLAWVALMAASFQFLALHEWVLAEPLALLLMAAALVVVSAAPAAGEPSPLRRGALCGLLLGAAIVTRWQALPVLGAAPLALWLERRRRTAVTVFVAALAPTLAWVTWRATRPAAALSPLLADDTGYGRYTILEGAARGWAEPLRLLGENLVALASGLGEWSVARGGLPALWLGLALAALAAAGALALVRRGRWLLVLWTLAGAAPLLLVLADSIRYLASIFPLVLMLALRALRPLAWSGRLRALVALALAANLGVTLAPALARRDFASVPGPADLGDGRGLWAGWLETARWLRRNTPDGAVLASVDDPFWFLYAGRRGVRYWPVDYLALLETRRHARAYRPGDPSELLTALRDLGVRWVVLSPLDVDRNTGGADLLALGRAIVALPAARARLAFTSSDRAHEVWQLDAAPAP